MQTRGQLEVIQTMNTKVYSWLSTCVAENCILLIISNPNQWTWIYKSKINGKKMHPEQDTDQQELLMYKNDSY